MDTIPTCDKCNKIFSNIQNLENAFVYDENKWYIREQEELNQDLLRKIYNYVESTKTVKKKDDVLNVMKHLFVLGGCGTRDVEKMSESQKISLYKEMGEKLRFETINIE